MEQPDYAPSLRDRYLVVGVEASPYTVKVRAVLRYRRLPHAWLCRMPQFYPPLAGVKPLLMPVVRFPDGSHHIDSTTIVGALERAHPGARSVLPADPVLAFQAALIEDMADEWMTKLLYFYRFNHAPDRRFAAAWVMDDAYPDLDAAALAEKAAAFLQRQDSRREIVGAQQENQPVLQAGFARLVETLKPAFALDRFLFGSRPSLADFALFGQLHTLCSDPTPSAIIRARAPRLEYWVRRAHDLSAVEGAWQQSPEPSDTVVNLLRLIGDTYLPYLAANAEADAAGRERFTVELADGSFTQPPFRFHVKCLAALRTAFAALTPADKARAAPLLRDTGCLAYLQ
jgi:glutathione S-transferase